MTINYRLSAPGFIPVMMDGKISVNRGFLDQQCALKWVRKNISAFGGDARNITLMGQSAGALSVSMHMMSEESSKYFDKLIVCSGGTNECMTINHAENRTFVFETKSPIISRKTTLASLAKTHSPKNAA